MPRSPVRILTALLPHFPLRSLSAPSLSPSFFQFPTSPRDQVGRLREVRHGLEGQPTFFFLEIKSNSESEHRVPCSLGSLDVISPSLTLSPLSTHTSLIHCTLPLYLCPFALLHTCASLVHSSAHFSTPRFSSVPATATDPFALSHLCIFPSRLSTAAPTHRRAYSYAPSTFHHHICALSASLHLHPPSFQTHSLGRKEKHPASPPQCRLTTCKGRGSEVRRLCGRRRRRGMTA